MFKSNAEILVIKICVMAQNISKQRLVWEGRLGFLVILFRPVLDAVTEEKCPLRLLRLSSIKPSETFE